MFCCSDNITASEKEILVRSEPYQLQDGRIFNDVNTEYFIRGANEDGTVIYFGINYCPFCGRALSRGLWAAEKKK
ncbi:uncharacterized protein METZ01_LOCUS138793 [marine metagenome]|uniref:Uncharacterized protein n=1 Tax=marine metagenome TaxID=408172 RepID=A0A381Z9R9_9ZZZZ